MLVSIIRQGVNIPWPSLTCCKISGYRTDHHCDNWLCPVLRYGVVQVVNRCATLLRTNGVSNGEHALARIYSAEHVLCTACLHTSPHGRSWSSHEDICWQRALFSLTSIYSFGAKQQRWPPLFSIDFIIQFHSTHSVTNSHCSLIVLCSCCCLACLSDDWLDSIWHALSIGPIVYSTVLFLTTMDPVAWENRRSDIGSKRWLCLLLWPGPKSQFVDLQSTLANYPSSLLPNVPQK